MSTKKFTPDNISKLKPCEIFVFGSNIQGEHVGGAALFAKKTFNAIDGYGFGIQGNSYAIPTCVRMWNGTKRMTKPFDNVNQIKPFVDAFISDANRFKGATFYVTKIGCGIAGFKASEVAELFRPCLDMDNVILPKEFVEWLIYPMVIDGLCKRGMKNVDVNDVMDFVMTWVDDDDNFTIGELLDDYKLKGNLLQLYIYRKEGI
jgi:hypothetical protein